MKKITLSWCCLAMYFLANAQVITIRDSATSQPLELASLVSEKPIAFATTNVKGQADISTFRGAEKIQIRMLGYKTIIRSYSELESSGLILLTLSGVSLDQVVVASTKWNQAGQDVPNKISSISMKQVALLNPQTAADLLGSSGEVFIQKSQQGGGSPMIRGFSTNRLLYSLDGVRMNTAIFRSGNIQNVISLDPFATERAEILFGPGSVIYGSDAIGGVMSFQTLTPQLSLSDKTLVTGKALTRFASANTELTGHFDVNVGWEKWAMLSSISYNDYNDLRMGRNGPDDYLRPFYVQRHDSADVVIKNDNPLAQAQSGYSQINLMQKLRFQPCEKWDLQYAFHYSATTDNPRYDRLIRARSNGLPRSAEWYYGPQAWMMHQISATHSSNNKAYDQMAVRLAHQKFEESRHDRDFNGTELRHRVEVVDAWSVNADFNKSIRNRHQLFYGLEYVMNDVASTGTDEDISTGVVTPGPARYPQATWTSYGAYASYHYNLHEKMIVQAGLRYNYFTIDALFDTAFYPFPFTNANIKDGAVTGSVGLVYNPNSQWTMRANFATGFRAPNVDDMGKVFDSEAGSVVVPNPDLKSEYACNFEAGIAKVFGDDVKIDVTGFYTILQDALVRRDYTLNGLDSIFYAGELSQVQAIQNAAKATVYGVQASLEVKLPAGFGISSVVNFQKGEEELDDGSVSPSRHVAPVFGMSSLTYTIQKLKLDFYAAYSGQVSFDNLADEGKANDFLFAKDENGNPFSPRWFTLNFKAMYQITENFSVSGGVENLTDQRYRTYSSGIAAAGRNFVLALRANF